MINKNIISINSTLKKIDPSLSKIFIPLILKHPKKIPSMIKLARVYKKSKRLRTKELIENDLKVPPFLILSITSKCNLSCKGCYASFNKFNDKEPQNAFLDIKQWKKIINESREIGIFCFIIAGGEPFIIPNLLNLCEEFNDRLFIIFSNGTLITEFHMKRLKRLKNILIVISIEGDEKMTDSRRGNGVYKKAIETLDALSNIGVFCGFSVTITKNNFSFWMNEKNIDDLISKEIHLGFFIEYIPIDNNKELMLDDVERETFRNKIIEFRTHKDIYLIHSPGDEEYFGGCISAGRGFAHVTPNGDLTPCPISPLSTHNLLKNSLREALMSPLFKYIRENEHLLETKNSPCALFYHSEELTDLVEKLSSHEKFLESMKK